MEPQDRLGEPPKKAAKVLRRNVVTSDDEDDTPAPETAVRVPCEAPPVVNAFELMMRGRTAPLAASKKKPVAQKKAPEVPPPEASEPVVEEQKKEEKPVEEAKEEEEKPVEEKDDAADIELDTKQEQEQQEQQQEEEEEESEEEYESSDSEQEEEKKEEKKKTTTTKKAKKPDVLKKGQPIVIRYDVEKDAGFKAGEAVPYLTLARAFAQIESTTLRLAKTEYLANMLRSIIHLTPGDLIQTLYLVAGKVAPDFENVEVGVGESLLVSAIADASGSTPAAVKALLREQGDLGKVAVLSKKKTQMLFAPAPLTVREVFSTLRFIALASGSASRAKKQDSIQRLLVSCREQEARYITRMLQGKFRIGCSEKTVLAALARALVQTPVPEPGSTAPSVLDASKTMGTEAFGAAVARAHAAITAALAQVPSYDVVVPLLLEPHGVEHVRARCHIRPGMPVHPMLAQPTKGVGEVLTRLAKVGFTCEYKYDGERAQIHLLTDRATGRRVVKVYSRNLEDTSAKYPDIVEACKAVAADGVDSCIIDSEAVGWDSATRRLLPFQTLMHRARKGVDARAVTVRVCIKAFDLLYLNGEALLERPFRERRALLHAHFRETEGSFMFATYKNIAPGDDESEAVQPFLLEAVAQQCEGLMVKALDAQSEYVPNQRSFNWLKIKKDYMDGMTDSVDLVPIAAWYGTGKRTGWYGGFLLACYDDDTEAFQSITKVGTGFSDADLAAFTKSLVPTPARKSYYTVSQNMKAPDVWFETTQVWEVKGADLTISPAYCAAAGLVDATKGVSLRFPRFLRVRDDKKPEDATKAEQIADLYNKQTLCITPPAAVHDENSF